MAALNKKQLMLKYRMAGEYDNMIVRKNGTQNYTKMKFNEMNKNKNK